MTSAVATPTLIARQPPFPTILPEPARPYPTGLPPRHRYTGRLKDRRDLEAEFAEMSAEEEEYEKLSEGIMNRAHKYYIPAGKVFTHDEEQAEETSEDEEDDDNPEVVNGEQGSQTEGSEGGEAEAEVDLDASMIDMDATGNMTATTAQTDLSAMMEEGDDDGEDMGD